MRKVKITVLRKEYYDDLAREHLSWAAVGEACPLLEEGDEFLYEGMAKMPEGFCPWAWVDIYSGVKALAAGGSFAPWNKHEGTQVLCCTDGVRPVVFLLQAVA